MKQKKQQKQTQTKPLTQLSAQDLENVSGGRYGVNRPPRTGQRPR